MNTADVARLLQQARRINTVRNWAEVARVLKAAGYHREARDAEDRANELILEKLEQK